MLFFFLFRHLSEEHILEFLIQKRQGKEDDSETDKDDNLAHRLHRPYVYEHQFYQYDAEFRKAHDADWFAMNAHAKTHKDESRRA